MTGSNSNAACDSGPCQSDQSVQTLFPLPLSAFERYMCLDDRRDYPMIFVLIIELKGALDRNLFEEALRLALKRHPLLTCHVASIQGQGPCWVPIERAEPQIQWTDGTTGTPDIDEEQIDLTRESGLRVWVNREATRSHVSFQFHHACTDGLGGVQVIGDVLAYYGQKTTPDGCEAPEIEPVDIERLRARTSFLAESSSSDPKQVSCPWRLCGKLWKLLRRGPVPLAATRHRDSPGIKLAFPALITRIIDRHVVQQLKVAAARQSVELNDLYLLELFQTMREWNRLHGDPSNRWFRIGMPTSLRTPQHDHMPAANIVSFMFLTRRASDCDQSEHLLQGIHRQTSAIVNEQQGRFLANGLKHVHKIPGLLWLLLRINRCFATAILSNVGDIKRQFTARFPLKQGRCVAGNVTLESLKGAVPIRSNTRVSVSVGTYAGNLYINMHCDPHSFSSEAAEQLTDMFVNRLKNQIPADVVTERHAA